MVLIRDITEFENPISGQKGSLFSLRDWTQLILGAVVISFVLGIAQALTGRFAAWFKPAAPYATKPLVDVPENVRIAFEGPMSNGGVVLH